MPASRSVISSASMKPFMAFRRSRKKTDSPAPSTSLVSKCQATIPYTVLHSFVSLPPSWLVSPNRNPAPPPLRFPTIKPWFWLMPGWRDGRSLDSAAPVLHGWGGRAAPVCHPAEHHRRRLGKRPGGYLGGAQGAETVAAQHSADEPRQSILTAASPFLVARSSNVHRRAASPKVSTALCSLNYPPSQKQYAPISRFSILKNVIDLPVLGLFWAIRVVILNLFFYLRVELETEIVSGSGSGVFGVSMDEIRCTIQCWLQCTVALNEISVPSLCRQSSPGYRPISWY